MRHVALIGLSGSGKSTVGRMLARELGTRFVDLDEVVEAKSGMSIREIFESRGEEFFRDMESSAVNEAASDINRTVIACGGGVVVRPENVRALRENCFVVFLDRPVEHILQDLPYDGTRPLASSADRLYEMERQRRQLYAAAADKTLENRGSASDAVSALTELMLTEDGGYIPGDYAVIGDPIAHSLSPKIHETVFGALGLKSRYNALRVQRGSLPDFARRARESKLMGFNVTMPHKRDIVPLLDETDEEARLCGSVNTVVSRNGRMIGFNTDMEGLLEALKERGAGYRGRKILILGAGGAARGVALKAALEGASEVVVLARREESARDAIALARSIAGCSVRSGGMSLGTMKTAAKDSDILINATPLGMSGIGEDFESLEFLSSLPSGAVVCDLVYNPAETKLLGVARSMGRSAQNGLGMLIYQALIADELFLDRKLDKKALYKIVEERLTK
jgi:shikimate dehydrogenase